MNPVLIFKTIGVSVGLGSGITGSIFSSFQAFTKISIEEFLKDDWATYSENSEWQILKKKLDDSQNIDEKKLDFVNLKEIKDKTKGKTGNDLKTWCENKKSFKIKKLLPSSFDSLLLDYVKSFCIITIGEKITTGKFTSFDSDKDQLTTKTTELTSHNEGDNSTKGKIDDIKELQEAKTKTGTDEKEKALFAWCQSTYKKTYKGSSDNLWKVANHYCKKT